MNKTENDQSQHQQQEDQEEQQEEEEEHEQKVKQLQQSKEEEDDEQEQKQEENEVEVEEKQVEELQQQQNYKSISNPPAPLELTMQASSPPPKPTSPPPPISPYPPSDHYYTSQSHPIPSPDLSPLSTNQTSYAHVFFPPHLDPLPPTPPSPPPKAQAAQQHDQQAGGDGTTATADADAIGGSGKRLRPSLSILRRAKMENIKRRTLLVFRISGFVFCLVSLSVLAADKNQGWALDSFYQYKEFRYCLSVNVIGFVYSGLQAYDLAYSLTSGKQIVRNHFRCLLDFSLDQTLTYLLLSASTSAVFRVEDWESNWGKDKFPAMARVSVVLSFLSFVAFALSSLVSGYTLFTPNSW